MEEKFRELFVSRSDVWAEAFLLPNKNKMAYSKHEGELTNKIILSHLNQIKTIGVYQLNKDKLKWTCLDFDINTKEDFENAKILYQKLKEGGKHPLLEMSGGGDYKCHIWLFCELTDTKNVKYYIEEFCKKLNIYPHEIFPKQFEANESLPYGNLVKLPLGLHLATNKKSIFLNDNFEPIITEEEISQRLKYQIENKDMFPEVIIQKVIIKEIINQQPTNVDEYDKFFDYVLHEELPAGPSKESSNQKIVGVNDNVIKNLAIYLIQKGFDDERLNNEIKPIYEERGWRFQGLMGWVKKARKDLNTICLGELINWCKVYKPELINLLNLEKIEDSEIQKTKVNFTNLTGSNSWSKIKGFAKRKMKERNELSFFAHKNNSIKGKPILFFPSIKQIKVIDKVEYENENKETQVDYKFLDEKFDGRVFKSVEQLYLDFWIYRLIYNSKEYLVMTETELGEEDCLLTGMSIELKDAADISRSLKLNVITPCFFMFSAEPSVKTLPKKELIEFTKKLEWDEDMFTNMTFLHPDGNIYSHTTEFNNLVTTFLLSGKYEGYPLHLLMMGPVGTGKTTLQECMNLKFQEAQGIFEAGNSTIKGLIPSFKENPASPGYILRCSRFALIDELMKMLDSAKTMYKDLFQIQFGQLNMLLEQKRRMVGSGSGNNFIAHSTAKILFTTNPLTGKPRIFDHALDMDGTTLSRMIIYVQNKEHQNAVRFGKKSKFPVDVLEKKFSHVNDENPKFGQKKSQSIFTNENKNTLSYLYLSSHKNLSEYIYIGLCDFIFSYLTIYDSCQEFLVEFNEDKIRGILRRILKTIQEPMKTIFHARGLHHSILLLDGITKKRCLFRDYDNTFTPSDEDYRKLEEMLNFVTKSWLTDLSLVDEVNIIEDGQLKLEDAGNDLGRRNF